MKVFRLASYKLMCTFISAASLLQMSYVNRSKNTARRKTRIVQVCIYHRIGMNVFRLASHKLLYAFLSAGYFCSYDLMANCTELADQYKDVLLLGNILGGVYCGNEEEDKLINCPRGRYCPDPETMLPCPGT